MTDHAPRCSLATEMAARWIVRLTSGATDAALLDELHGWLQASPENQREFEAMCRLWEGLHRLTEFV